MSNKKGWAMTTAALLWSLPAHAADFLSLGGVSYHFDRHEDRNEFNYGLGYEHDVSERLALFGGVYKNSFSRASFYALADYAVWKPTENLRFSIVGGGATGYRRAAVIPVAFPGIEWRVTSLSIKVFALPPLKHYIEGAVALQLSIQLKP